MADWKSVKTHADRVAVQRAARDGLVSPDIDRVIHSLNLGELDTDNVRRMAGEAMGSMLTDAADWAEIVATARKDPVTFIACIEAAARFVVTGPLPPDLAVFTAGVLRGEIAMPSVRLTEFELTFRHREIRRAVQREIDRGVPLPVAQAWVAEALRHLGLRPMTARGVEAIWHSS